MSSKTYLEKINRRILELNKESKKSVETSISTLERHLENWDKFDTVVEHKAFGSFVRETNLPKCIASTADVDYMIVFNTTDKKPQTYLNYVKEFVDLKYPNSKRYQDHPTIALDLNNIKFEIMPAIQLWGKAFPGYNIPAPASVVLEWINTYPQKLQEDLDEADKRNGGMLRPVIRLIKYWNVLNGKILTSFRIEEYVISHIFFNCSDLSDYFYDAVRYLAQAEALDDNRRQKLYSFTSSIEMAISHRYLRNDLSAEVILRKLLPEL